jgi:hypothetical protein
MSIFPLPYTIPGKKDVAETRESELQADFSRLVNGLNITQAGSKIVETKTKDNTIMLSSGGFGGSRLQKEYTLIGGFADSRMERKVVVVATRLTLDGITFVNSPSSVGTLLSIGPDSVVFFRNCIFNMSQPDGDKIWISMESGARAVFNGCMWRGGDGTGGNLVNNAGAAANVQIVGCMFGPTAPGATFVNCSAPVASL